MKRRFHVILIALMSVFALAIVFELTRPYRPDNPIDAQIDRMVGGRELITIDAEPAEEEFQVYLELPAGSDISGMLQVSSNRQAYGDGEMILIIPAIDFHDSVNSGTTRSALRDRPGLFESSGLPGEPGANVSIAGHRTRDAFYFLDRISDGDQLYLIYGTEIFTYVYYDSSVIYPNEWDVITDQGFDVCTLITCTPIGRANRRLVVRFILESVAQVDESGFDELM